MIEGLYEAHLPVKDLAISMEFYKKIGLKMAWMDEDTAFFWIEENKSWVGLWEGKNIKLHITLHYGISLFEYLMKT